MNTRLVLDKAGRIVIPKTLRDAMHLEPGDCFELENTDEQITLRPVRAASPLRRKQGVWVFSIGEKVSQETTNATLEQIREGRE